MSLSKQEHHTTEGEELEEIEEVKEEEEKEEKEERYGSHLQVLLPNLLLRQSRRCGVSPALDKERQCYGTNAWGLDENSSFIPPIN